MDPVRLTLEILSEAFDGIPVTTEIPATKNERLPERLVVVTLEGMETDGFVIMPHMAITCWGRSDRDAFSMAQFAHEALVEAAEDHPYLSAVELDTIARDEWTATGRARYYAAMRLYINTDE